MRPFPPSALTKDPENDEAKDTAAREVNVRASNTEVVTTVRNEMPDGCPALFATVDGSSSCTSEMLLKLQGVVTRDSVDKAIAYTIKRSLCP